MAATAETPEQLRAQAEHLRELARQVIDRRALAELQRMIERLEQRARELDTRA